MKAARRRHDSALIQVLAAGAAIWAALWLALVMTPTGLVPFLDRTYALLISPFEFSPRGDFLLRRIIEFAALLPAVVLLAAAQARRKRRHERGGAGPS